MSKRKRKATKKRGGGGGVTAAKITWENSLRGGGGVIPYSADEISQRATYRYMILIILISSNIKRK